MIMTWCDDEFHGGMSLGRGAPWKETRWGSKVVPSYTYLLIYRIRRGVNHCILRLDYL